MTNTINKFIALGDSISIDDYPKLETGINHIGAVSLFGRYLRKLNPSLRVKNLTRDGATSRDVLDLQLPRIVSSDAPTLVTITAGGNDLLTYLWTRKRAPSGFVDSILGRLTAIIIMLGRRLPSSTIFVNTVYDPSDGTNILYGKRLDKAAKWLAELNAGIRELDAFERVRVVDIHERFLGHGVTVDEDDQWYWSELIFEPNAKGARVIADLWLTEFQKETLND